MVTETPEAQDKAKKVNCDWRNRVKLETASG